MSATGKPRVLHVTAVDVSLRYLLDHQLVWLREHGFEVHCAASPGPYTDYIRRELGVPFHPIRLTRRIASARDLLGLVDLIRLLRRERFDIVHTHTLKPMLVGALAARLAGVPIVVNTLRPYLQDHQPWYVRRPLMWIDRLMAALTTRIVAQNPDDVERYVGLSICPRRKISPLGNGIDLERFDPSRFDAADRRAFRASHGIAPDAFVVGMVGRWVRAKGYEEFFEVLGRLAAVDPRVCFLTAGSEWSSRRGLLSEDLPRRYGLEGRGVHLGHRDDLPLVYASMDLLLFPSRRDAFPRVLMEAAAMGLPLVSTRTSGGSRCVRHGVNGYLVDVGDVEAMLERALELLRTPEACRSMGQASRRLALAEFDEQRVFERTEACYLELLSEHGRSPASAWR